MTNSVIKIANRKKITMKIKLLKTRLFQIVCLLIIILAGIFYGVYCMQPSPLPANEAEQGYYQTFYNHISEIAQEPHAAYTEGNQRVQEYLVECFQNMGVSYEAIAFEQNHKQFTDYLVKLEAPDTDNGVLFTAHFDCEYGSHGALDDGMGVASLLTVIEEVTAKGTPKNDMYFLFTDGEELGLIGSTYFVENYGEFLKDKVSFVVNMEGRGCRGTTVLFETSEQNYESAIMLSKALSSGCCPFSASTQIYQKMPNNTDLTPFMKAGFQGINFTVMDGGECYHSAEDKIENLKQDTAYTYYKTLKELADYLQNADLSTLEGTKKGVFFPVFKGKFFVCKEASMNAFCMITMILFGILLIYSFTVRRIQKDKLILSVSVAGLYFVVSCIVLFIMNTIMSKLLISKGIMEAAQIKQNIYIVQMFILLILGLLVPVVTHKFLRLQEHLIISGIWFLILCLICVVAFRGFTYLFCIPLCVITIMLFFTVVYRGRMTKYLVPILSILLIAVCSAIYVPAIILAYQSMLIAMEHFAVLFYLTLVEWGLFYLCIISFIESFEIQTTGGSKRRRRSFGSYKSILRKLIGSCLLSFILLFSACGTGNSSDSNKNALNDTEQAQIQNEEQNTNEEQNGNEEENESTINDEDIHGIEQLSFTEEALLTDVLTTLQQKNIAYAGFYNKSGERIDLNLQDGRSLLFLKTTDSEGNDTGYKLIMDGDYFNQACFQEDYFNAYDVISDEDYFPDLSDRYITEDNLWNIGNQTNCMILRNQIYAKHGRSFKDSFVQNIFNQKNWYHPAENEISDTDILDELSDMEKENLLVILEFEEKRGYRNANREIVSKGLVDGSFFDLDGDGKLEQISFSLEAEDEDLELYTITVVDGVTNAKISIQEENLNMDSICYIGSMDLKEWFLMVASDGMSADFSVSLYRYQNGKLIDLGCIDTEIGNLKFYSDHMEGYVETFHIQCQPLLFSYHLDGNSIVFDWKEVYEYQKNTVTALKDMKLCADMSEHYNGLMIHKGDRMIIISGDNKEWVLLENADTGEQGYMKVINGRCFMEDGTEVESSLCFDGLYFYG